jgi:Protein of unknown function (DUF3311)
LLLPYVGLQWVAFYNFRDPTLFGFPFFYWYQLAWVPLSSLLTWTGLTPMKTDVDNAALAHTAIFIVLGFLAARRFHPEAPQRATTYSSVLQSTKRAKLNFRPTQSRGCPSAIVHRRSRSRKFNPAGFAR